MIKSLFAWIVGIQMVLGSGLAFAQVVEKQSPFDESVWRVESLQGQKRTLQTYQGEKNYASISFNPYSHKVTGRGLCNKFLGKFSQGKNTVTIQDIVTTNETCLSNDVNAQDARFFSYLKSIKSYSIHGKVLKLLDAQNNPLIIARWAK